jgi:hypothetical protein
MFFAYPVLERFLLIFPVYLLFFSVFTYLFFLKENKKANLIFLNSVLFVLFINYFALFFYIKNSDIVANFYIERFLVFLFILLLILISFNKTENYKQSIGILIYLFAVMGIVFFDNIFLIVFSLILINIINFYYKIDEKTVFLKKNIFIFFILFFLMGFLISGGNEQVKKIFFNGIIISIIFFINIKKGSISDSISNLHLFFLNGVIYLIVFLKFIEKYYFLIIWQPIMFLLIIFLIISIFYSLTEEIFKKFLIYDYLSNLYFSYLFLFITEFKRINFLIIILFFTIFLFNYFIFSKHIETNKITVSYAKYNLNKIKSNILIIFNVLIGLIYNIFLIFQIKKYLLNDPFLKMIVIFGLIFFSVAILNKFFIFISMTKSIAKESFLKFLKERQIYMLVLFLIFISILIFNLDMKIAR